MVATTFPEVTFDQHSPPEGGDKPAVAEPLASGGPISESPPREASGRIPRGAAVQDGIGFVLEHARRFELLSRDDELSLGRAMWRARRRIRYALWRWGRGHNVSSAEFASIGAPSRPLSAAQRSRLLVAEARAAEIANYGTDRSAAGLVRRELASIEHSRRRLVHHNMRLVVWVSKSFRNRGLDLADLTQEGFVGLIRASERYDPCVGTRFGTYATWAIRTSIQRALAEKGSMIRVPLYLLPDLRELNETRTKLSERLDRTPNVDELAEAFGGSRDKVLDLVNATGPVNSMESPLGSTNLTLGEIMVDETDGPFETTALKEQTQLIRDLISELPQRSRDIITMRFGFVDGETATLEEIGKTLGLSRERIRQLEKAAREDLKQLLLRRSPELSG